MKRFVFGKIMGVGSFSIIATFLLLSILNIDSWAYDRTVYDLEINNPILNDGNNNDGWIHWINNDEDFYYTDGFNSDAKASWTFPECSKSGDYRVLIELPKDHNHSSGSVSYQIYKNTQTLNVCPVNQSLFDGYCSLGNSANTHHLFYLEEGDIIKIEFTTDEANVTVGKAMLSYIEDFSLPIDQYSQTDERWRCKKLFDASSESDANCTGDPIPNPCGYYKIYNNTGPMGCWGCTTCAFTSALSYYGVCEVNINGKKKP